MTPKVSVILPTTSSAERAIMIRWSIDSVKRASSKRICIFVVANGARVDYSLLNDSRMQNDIRVEKLERASLPGVIVRGKRCIETPFFALIDDDDEYLADDLDRRLEVLDSDSRFDLVITRGFRQIGVTDYPLFSNASDAAVKALDALLSARDWVVATLCTGLRRWTMITLPLRSNLQNGLGLHFG